MGGSLTPISAIQALTSANKIAVYSIYGDFKRANRDMNFYTPSAIMTVNFGSSNFTSNWSHIDGGPMSSATISGTVTGNSFQSNSLSYSNYYMPPTAVTGEMKGNFNGTQAQALSGSLTVNVSGQTTEGVFIGQQVNNTVNEIPNGNLDL